MPVHALIYGPYNGEGQPEWIQLLADKVALYDTTLRDGSQTEGVSFSTEDKLDILKRLDHFGMDYIEGGWPGSNPKDAAFFEAASSMRLKHARLTAFGSTRRAGITAAEDVNLRTIVASGAECVAIFGKAWDLHVSNALKISNEENLELGRQRVPQVQRPRIFAPALSTGMPTTPVRHGVGGGRLGRRRLAVLCDTTGARCPASSARP